jgi:histidyl-tRNA synthetase
MRDFLPAEKARRERLLAVIRASYRAHGFDEIETPVAEDSDRLHAGLGGDNEKLAFGILKRGLSADDLHQATEPLDLVDLGLRFDLTVPLARYYATHRAELPSVFRSIQLAPVWRAERPQKGRYRQFVQCDIDIIGEPGIRAEAELLVATLATVDALGLDGSTIRVNDRRILRAIALYIGVTDADLDRAFIILDKEDKIGIEGVVAELQELGLTDAELITSVLVANQQAGWDILDEGSPRPAWLDADAEAAYLELLELVAVAGDRLVFSPNLVRGMGYYTGPIFELAHPSVPYSLGGGGRYDGMIGRFLGTEVPATGFSLGFERLVDLLELNDVAAGDATALLHDAAVPVATLLALKSALIAEGGRVRLVARPKNTKTLLESLQADGFTRFAFVDAGVETVADLQLRPLGS